MFVLQMLQAAHSSRFAGKEARVMCLKMLDAAAITGEDIADVALCRGICD